MYDLDHRQYTDEIDDRSQAIVGVTKTVSRLPPSRTGPGVYISYATRGWVSRSKTKPISLSTLQQPRSRIPIIGFGVILSLLLCVCFMYRQHDKINVWFQGIEWQSWIKGWLATLQQQSDSVLATWNVQVERIQHVIKAYIEDDQLLYDRIVSRMSRLSAELEHYQPRQWMDILLTRAERVSLWLWKSGQAIQEQVTAWFHDHQDDIVEIVEIDLNDEIIM
ncbi:predicted protein [Lichtheimia corymbifera JMRC:FSU:9682]|uniref:Uncharacterized protein n=1 Tax=Lichtheimia corymbifera JMRC:FSU:9682 TaxID=1263082 RepID=A0A068RR93_9FUNG|nr:predicted protein [Lichtheimia corymbifera JMRC:FSU:9682]